ncbi:MAG: T9SS type A sorting domain-containing protein [Flavobacteriales bacterium]
MATTTYAQQFLISQAQISTCTGVLLDSGGPDDPYGDNETFTTTICPNVPGRKTVLNWQEFDLSLNGTASTQDRVEIWDGSNVLGLYLGAYTGTELAGLFVEATYFNPTGCLTVRFTSNSSGTGNFAASISCSGVVPACNTPPTAVNSTILPDPTVLCVGDTLFLDGSGSTPYDGTSLIEWHWTTGNSAPFVSTTPIDTLVITEPGLLALQLQVVSNTGCSSQLTPAQYILASGPVHFNGTTAPSGVCYPDEAALVGHATLMPFVHVNAVGGEYGTGIPLLDLVAEPQALTSTIAWAEPGSVITSAADLGEICLEMEHSFMGDLIITLECPNGTEVILEAQGGGNTFLGDASDDLPGGIPGTCWNYCFSASPDHGMWAECVASSNTPNVIPLNTTDVALAPGSYTPSGELDDFIGCPVNGTWTLTFYDLWGGDDGSLCSWSMGLPMAYDSSFADLSATLDLTDGSVTYWSGAGVLNSATDPTMATMEIPTAGAFNPVFTVIDSYGCAFDTTITILGVEGPVVEAGSDLSICANDASLSGEVSFGASDSCTYTLVFLRPSLNGLISSARVRVTTMGDTAVYWSTGSLWRSYEFTVADGEAFELTAVQGANSNRVQLFDPNGDLLFDSDWPVVTGFLYAGIGNCNGVLPEFGSISWSPTIGLSDPSDPTTVIGAPASGWYTLSASYLNGCSVADSVFVTDLGGSAALSWNSTDSLLCADQSVSGIYDWYRDGALFTTTSTPCLSDPPYGAWSLTAELDGDCSYVSDTLLICPVLELEQIGNTLQATELPGVYTWYYNGVVIPGEELASLTFAAAGAYTVTLDMPFGCALTDSIIAMDPTGIARNALDHVIHILPNPCNGIFRIRGTIGTGKEWILELTDLAGRVVFTERSVHDINGKVLDVSGLAAGNYVLQVGAGAEQYREKLVIQR